MEIQYPEPKLEEPVEPQQQIEQDLKLNENFNVEKLYKGAPTDEEFEELDRYANLTSSFAKGIKHAGKAMVDFLTPKVKKQTDYIEERGGIKNIVGEVDKKDVEGLLNSKYVEYGEDKPSYMVRSDDGATYKLDNLKSDEDIDSAVQYMAEANKKGITEARRGVVTDVEAKNLARDLGINPTEMHKLLTRPDGSTANVEEIIAMRQMMDSSARRLRSLAKLVDEGTATAEQSVEFDKSFLFHKDLQSKFMAFRAEAGRSTRAYGINLSGMDGEREVLDMAMSGYNSKRIATMLALTDDTAGLNSTMDGLKSVGRRTLDASTTLFTYSILSGVETQMVNILGSSTQLIQRGFERNLSEFGTRGRLLLGLDVDGLTAIGETQIIRQGYLANFLPAIKVGYRVLKTGDSYGNLGKFVSYDNAFSPAQTGLKEGSPLASTVHMGGNLTGFMVRNVMGATDGFFKKLTESSEYLALSYRKAWHEINALKVPKDEFDKRVLERFDYYVKNPDPSTKNQAIELSKEVTYQDSTKLGQAMQQAVKLAPPLKFIVPFINTPASIANQHLLLRNPLRIFNPSSPVWDISSQAGQQARAEVMTGASIMAGAWALADMGVLTGATPTDAKERAQWEANGIKSNSIRMINEEGKITYLSLDRVEGLSYPSSIILEVKRLYENKIIDWELSGEDPQVAEVVMELMADVLYVGSKAMQDKTYLQGLSTIFDIMGSRTDDEAQDRWNRLATNIVAPTIVPFSSLQRDFNYAFSDSANFKDTREFEDKVKASIMWLDKNVPNKLDIFGYEIHRQRLTPIKYTKGKGSKIVDELERISKVTGEGIVGMPKRNQFGVRLTSQEYHDMVKYVRGTDEFEELLYGLTSESSFPNDFSKSTIIKNAVSKFDNAMINAFIHGTDDGAELRERISELQMIRNKRKGRVE